MTFERALEGMSFSGPPQYVEKEAFAAIAARGAAAVKPLLDVMQKKDGRFDSRTVIEAVHRLMLAVKDDESVRNLLTTLMLLTSADGYDGESWSYAAEKIKTQPPATPLLVTAMVKLLDHRRGDRTAIVDRWVEPVCKAIEANPGAALPCVKELAAHFLDDSDPDRAEAAGKVLRAFGWDRLEPARDAVLAALRKRRFRQLEQLAVDIAGFVGNREIIAELSAIAQRPVREYDDSGIMLHLCAILALVRCGVWNPSFLKDAHEMPEQQWHIDTGYRQDSRSDGGE